MKYLTYFLMAIASACLVILLSLTACSPTRQATTQPVVMDHSPAAQPTASPGQAQVQPQTTPSAAVTATVKIHNFKFEPATVTIATGEAIQFINVDEEPHTATSTDGVFNSKALDTNQTWNYTATKPGSFPYICSIHPFMKGTLTVTPKKA